MSSIILSTAYFPNIQYISKFMKGKNIIIDIYEHYSRQSYRNRCNILSANGVLSLSVPIIKNNNSYTKDVEIDYSTNWQKNHKIAILSAYKNSPYYDYYINEFNFVFEKEEKYLIELNFKILDKILKILKANNFYEISTDFIRETENNFRESISPKKSKNIIDPDFKSEKYYQIFSDKFGFIENLSFLDLLFMNGPESILYLK